MFAQCTCSDPKKAILDLELMQRHIFCKFLKFVLVKGKKNVACWDQMGGGGESGCRWRNTNCGGISTAWGRERGGLGSIQYTFSITGWIRIKGKPTRISIDE